MLKVIIAGQVDRTRRVARDAKMHRDDGSLAVLGCKRPQIPDFHYILGTSLPNCKAASGISCGLIGQCGYNKGRFHFSRFAPLGSGTPFMLFMRHPQVGSRKARLVVSFVVTIIGLSVFATEAARAGAKESSARSTATTESMDATSIEMINALIEELGANKFAIRERATQQLTAIGPSILEPLSAGLTHPDPEIRIRSRRVYVRVKQVARLDRLQAFVTHPDLGSSPENAELPGWKALSEAVGDSPASRNLLVAVLRDNWDLIESFEALEEGQTDVAANHIRQLKEQSRLNRELLNVERVTAAILLTQDPRSNVPDTEMANLLGILHQLSASSSSRATAVGDPWKHEPFRSLVSRLLVRCTEPASAWQTFSLALRHNLEAAVEPALTVIEDRESRPHIRQYALLTIAKFGSEENVDQIKQLLDDTDICYRREDPRTKKAKFECQVRDVAFATLIHLTSGDPRQFGFVNAKSNSYSVYQPSTLGFANDDERKVAYAKWESESGEQLIQATDPAAE